MLTEFTPEYRADLLRRVFDRLVDSGDGCYMWPGSKRRGGYGSVRVGFRDDDSWRLETVTRVVYELVKGPIPEGYEVSHTCRRPACAAPDHLVALPHDEVVRRGDAPLVQLSKIRCPAGHPYDRRNTYYYPDGRRDCRACRRARRARYRARLASGQFPRTP